MPWSKSGILPLWLVLPAWAGLLGLGLIAAQTTSPPGNQNPTQAQSSATNLPLSAAPAQGPVVMLDPAHGGSESGAVLTPTILEKDVTLSFARRLRQDLTSHGIVAELVRDADINLSTDDRASRANAAAPLLYVSLHASSLIGSTRFFSPLLNATGENSGPFVAWDRAQERSLATSRAVVEQLLPAFQKAGLSMRALEVSMRPLNNVTAPAIAIELAPRSPEISQLMAADFQTPISVALANGIAASIPTLTSAAGAQK